MVDLQNTWLLAFILAFASLTVGCVNLDKRDPAPFRLGQKTTEGQTVATKNGPKKSASQMKKMSKPSGFAKAVKGAWPFQRKAKMTVQEQPLAADDPTRLDYMPGNLGPDLYVAAARVAEQNGDYKRAVEQYNLALAADGQYRNGFIGLARLQHRMGKTNEAIQLYRRALESHQDDPVILNDLGICYATIKHFDDAIDVLSMATRLSPEREMYANNLAAALVQANRADEALNHLRRVRAPEIANYNIGFLLAESGRKDEAANYLSESLAINPEFEPARKLLDNLSPTMARALPHREPQPFRRVSSEPLAPPSKLASESDTPIRYGQSH